MPRDGQLIVYGENGRRFWVERLDKHEIKFPPAARFQWGQKLTWEVRKATGGRVLNGAFEIASEEDAARLINATLPASQSVPAEQLVFYAVQLELEQAYPRAQEVWKQLGVAPFR